MNGENRKNKERVDDELAQRAYERTENEEEGSREELEELKSLVAN